MAGTKAARKSLTGTVLSTNMDKTVVVSIERLKKHSLYGKYMKTRVKYMAHDEKNECNPNDKVSIVETRPLSKNKNWRVHTVLEKAK